MLVDGLRRQGDTLYRWRSYLPVPLALLLFVAMALPPASRWPFTAGWWEWLALSVSLAGLAVRIYTIGYAPPFTSGGNTHKQVADELNTSGMYSLVRHPLYLGNLLMWLGPALLVGSIWLPIITVLVFWLYYERIMCAEEHFLERRFGAVFREWSTSTPALLPMGSTWRSSGSPFSARRVLRREHNALLATAVLFSSLNLWRSWIHGRGLLLATEWIVLLIVATTIFGFCLILKKTTSLLEHTPRRRVGRALRAPVCD